MPKITEDNMVPSKPFELVVITGETPAIVAAGGGYFQGERVLNVASALPYLDEDYRRAIGEAKRDTKKDGRRRTVLIRQTMAQVVIDREEAPKTNQPQWRTWFVEIDNTDIPHKGKSPKLAEIAAFIRQKMLGNSVIGVVENLRVLGGQIAFDSECSGADLRTQLTQRGLVVGNLWIPRPDELAAARLGK